MSTVGTPCVARRAARAPQRSGVPQVPPGSFGARLQATVAYLTGRLAVSHRDCVEAIAVLHGAALSLGSISAVQRRVSAALAAPVETAEKFVRRQKINHVDETTWRERDRLSWLWVNATPHVTSFRITPRRGAVTAREVIGRAKTSVTRDGSLQGLQLVGSAAAASLLGTSGARLPGDGGARWRGSRDR